MKNLIKLIVIIAIATLTSCKGCVADYQERVQGLQKVCPNCLLSTQYNTYYAIDTSKQPNIVYIVYFKPGGVFYKASDVDHLEIIK